MKSFATILLLAAGMFVKSSAQTTDSPPASSGSLEIVLNFQKEYTWGTNAVVEELVVFSAATNITMEVTFRNVGERNMDHLGLLVGLTVVWDGKEYSYGGKRVRGWNGARYFSPHTGWRVGFPLSDYLIPDEALASGRHTIAVKDAGLESNIQTIFIEPQK